MSTAGATLADAQRETLLAQVSVWRAQRSDPGDLAVMPALRFRLECPDFDGWIS